MTIGKRYAVRGTKFQVETSRGAAKTITAVTKANPAVLTATAHGLAIGQTVYIDISAAMPDFAPGEYVVTAVPTANTFSVAGVDSTNFGTFAAPSPNTAAAYLVVFSDFCELTGYNQQDGTADTIDATTVCSTAKEFEVGLPDSGTLSLDYNAAPLASVQVALRAARSSGSTIAVRMVFPKQGGTVIMFGAVQSTSLSGDVAGLHKGSASIKLTGDIVVTA